MYIRRPPLLQRFLLEERVGERRQEPGARSQEAKNT
jgi:hypothetical protein